MGISRRDGSLIGRLSELEELREALARCREGSACVVTVAGEPGIGKSRLLAELAAHAKAEGWAVLGGRSADYLRRVPFGTFADALDEHLEAIDPAVIDAVGRQALAVAFPSVSPQGGGPGTPVQRVRVYRAMSHLLERVSGVGLVLLLDDLHWADDATIELLAYLLRRPPRTAVLFVLAYRSRQAPDRLVAAVEAARDGVVGCCLELGPLTAEEADELIPRGGSRRWRRTVRDLGVGNPFYLKALSRSGGPLPQGGRDGVAELPRAVSAALLAELDGLSPLARGVAESAAVLGEVFEAGPAAVVAGIDLDGVLAAIDELAAADIVRQAEGRRFTFRHALVRRAVYSTADPGWRLAAHARAATELERLGASLVARAHHIELCAEAGDLTAVDQLTAAARSICSRSAATAAMWLRAALRLLADDESSAERRLAILRRLAGCLGVAGHLQESREAADEVLSLLPYERTPRRARAVTAFARVERMLGRYAEAHALLDGEVAVLSNPHTREGGRLKLELASTELIRGDVGPGRAWALEALATVRRRDDRPGEAAALAILTAATSISGDVASATGVLGRAARRIDGLLDSELAERVDAAVWIVWSEMVLDRHPDALRHADRAIMVACGTEQELALPYLLAQRAALLAWSGRLAEARGCSQDALEMSLLCGGHEARASAYAVSCRIATQTGDIKAALAAGGAAIEHAASSTGWYQALGLRALAEARLAAGDTSGCIASVDQAGGPELAAADAWSRVAWYEMLTRADLARGSFVGAAAWAARAADAAEVTGLASRLGLAALAGAQVELDHDPGAAVRQARAAADAFSSVGMVIETARARLTTGQALAAAGDRRQAATETKAAQAIFAAGGARPLLRQAIRQQRRLAATGPQNDRGGRGPIHLTAREHEIALLVTEGLTNRQIAGRLYIAEKTVEMHISNVFAKLGVSTRTAVANGLARADGGLA